MTPSRAVRLLSGGLLILALGCFVLTLVRITIDQAAVEQLQQLLPNAGKLPRSCIDDGVVSYTGISVMRGGSPSINNACLPGVKDPSEATLGAQPLVLLAVALLLIGIAIAARGWRWHRAVLVAICLVAIGLLVVDNLRFYTIFAARFPGADQGGGPSLLDSQAGPGLWALLGLLAGVIVLNAAYAGILFSRRALQRV